MKRKVSGPTRIRVTVPKRGVLRFRYLSYTVDIHESNELPRYTFLVSRKGKIVTSFPRDNDVLGMLEVIRYINKETDNDDDNE